MRTLRDRFIARRHTALLVAIVVAFVVRPLLGDAGLALGLFSIALVALLVVALYNIQVDELVGDRDALHAQRRRRTVVGWSLAVLAITERLVALYAPTPAVRLWGSISWLSFFAFIAWSQLRSVLQQKQVTSETISASISVYLLLGFTWGLLYIVLFDLQPAAFNIPYPAVAEHPETAFPVLLYFSLTTLTTIGYGDITPLTLPARYAAVAEGIVGQFYLAILVARLVGMQMSGSTSTPENRSGSPEGNETK